MLSIDNIEVLVTDWDETVTEQDTMAVLAEAAYLHKEDFEPTWDYFGDHYFKDYRKYSDNFERPRTSLDAETHFLKGLKEVELSSVRRVEGSKLFANVPEEAIRAQAGKVPIRSGFWDVLSIVKERGIPVVVISVNWSSALIQEVLKRRGFGDVVAVTANDIEMDPTGKGTGRLCGRLHSAHDKLEVLRKVRAEYPGQKLYYFGDSGTDLLGLLEADVGVIVHKKQLVDRLGELGIQVRHYKERSDNDSLYYLDEWTSLL